MFSAGLQYVRTTQVAEFNMINGVMYRFKYINIFAQVTKMSGKAAKRSDEDDQSKRTPRKQKIALQEEEEEEEVEEEDEGDTFPRLPTPRKRAPVGRDAKG